MRTRLDRYILGSILKVGLVAMLLCSLILVLVDLLANLERYIQLAVPFPTIALRTLYYLPEAVLLATGPAFLFSITYFLSMLRANNELICLLNSGISYRRILLPIALCSILITAGHFVFNETVGIPALREKELLNDKIFLSSANYDNRDITLSDRPRGYLLYARRYSDAERKLYGAVLVHKDPSTGDLLMKASSEEAVWDEEAGNWEFHDATIHRVRGQSVAPETLDAFVAEGLDLRPELFRNARGDIRTMDLKAALERLESIKEHDREQYSAAATDFYQRLLSCLTPLVLMIIACCQNYRFKKNVLLFSIVWSLCVGVVYYVVQMLSLIMAGQGMIAPPLGMLVPFGVILLLSLALSVAFRF